MSQFGWTPNPDAVEQFVEQSNVGELRYKAPSLMTTEKKDTFLWLPLLKLKPNWVRGAQGIGDCVSWGNELCVTMAMAIQHELGVSTWENEAATEPIYGGGRADINGRNGGWGDGSYGAAAAKWLRNWGVLLRKDYSKITGNPEHDLTKYSSSKAKQWGNYGCGGSKDALGSGPLDAIAKKHPAKTVTLVSTVDEAAAAIMNGYPVAVCSGVGYGGMRRNNDGIVRRSGSWSHCMMFGGVRWVNGEPQFRQFQSWGRSASGPDPGITHEAVSWCSWWTVAEDAAAQLRGRDSFAFSDVEGFPKRDLDFIKAASTWN